MATSPDFGLGGVGSIHLETDAPSTGELAVQGIVAAATGLALLVLLPLLISWMKPFSRRKGRLRDIGSGIDAGFAVFDPAKARAIQTMEIRNEVGHADEGDQGDLHDPSHAP